MKLPIVYIALALIEVRRYGIDSGGISDQYHPIGQLTWKQMQMEYRPIGIKNKFWCWNRFHRENVYSAKYTNFSFLNILVRIFLRDKILECHYFSSRYTYHSEQGGKPDEESPATCYSGFCHSECTRETPSHTFNGRGFFTSLRFVQNDTIVIPNACEEFLLSSRMQMRDLMQTLA